MFDEREVVTWEKNKSWLFFVDPGETVEAAGSDGTNNFDENDGNWVSFWNLTNLFKIGPTDLSRIICQSSIQPYYRDGNGLDGYQIKPANTDGGFPSWLFDEGLFHRFELGKIKKLIAEQEEVPGKSEKTQQYEDESSALKTENAKIRSLIDSLELSNSNLAQQLAEREEAIVKIEAINQDLQSSLNAASASPHRWKPSCDALFQAFRQIVESTRDDWVQDEFLALAGRLYDNNGDKRGVLAEAGRLAWAALPDRFKAGPGNPKYKGNPTKE